MMYLLVVFGFPAYLYAAERVAAGVRRAKLHDRRAVATYPLTANDPVGRSVIF
jgi:hypothetical protein